MGGIEDAFQLAVRLHQTGDHAGAESLYRRILAESPSHAPTLHLMGVLAIQRKQFAEAGELIARAIEIAPDFAAYHVNLAVARRRSGDLAGAADALNTALRLAPASADAHTKRGTLLRLLGRIDEARVSCESAVRLDPNSAEARAELGTILLQSGRLDDAIAHLREAIRLWPQYPEAHTRLAMAFHAADRPREAQAEYQQAIRLDPSAGDAYDGLGTLMRQLGRLDECIAARTSAVQVRPHNADALTNLGNALKDAGRLDEAIACYRRAVELNHGSPDLHSNLIYTLCFHPAPDARNQIAHEQREWVRRHAEPLAGRIRPHDNDRTPDRRLRIGYVSPDLREHVVGRNVLPLFRHHDPVQVEVFCYSDAREPDALTEKFRQHSDAWHDTARESDEALADLVRNDRIDVLVDLTQHMAGNRLRTFATKPAPVQISFAGYPAGTGLPAIDYRISDRYLDLPPEGDEAANDGILRLNTFWCYEPATDVPANELPATNSGRITFGCLNNFCKVNADVLRLWAAVMTEVPDSSLLLLSHEGSHRAATAQFIASFGVEPGRVEFASPRPREDYLKLYHRIDLALDTFPYNGHTTSLDALWMGVPTATLAGQHSLGRAGVSQLSNMGLVDLIAETPEQFVSIAARTAQDLPRLATLRLGLREWMRRTPLTDAEAFARDIEAVYRQAWRRYCLSRT